MFIATAVWEMYRRTMKARRVTLTIFGSLGNRIPELYLMRTPMDTPKLLCMGGL